MLRHKTSQADFVTLSSVARAPERLQSAEVPFLAYAARDYAMSRAELGDQLYETLLEVFQHFVLQREAARRDPISKQLIHHSMMFKQLLENKLVIQLVHNVRDTHDRRSVLDETKIVLERLVVESGSYPSMNHSEFLVFWERVDDAIRPIRTRLLQDETDASLRRPTTSQELYVPGTYPREWRIRFWGSRPRLHLESSCGKYLVWLERNGRRALDVERAEDWEVMSRLEEGLSKNGLLQVFESGWTVTMLGFGWLKLEWRSSTELRLHAYPGLPEAFSRRVVLEAPIRPQDVLLSSATRALHIEDQSPRYLYDLLWTRSSALECSTEPRVAGRERVQFQSQLEALLAQVYLDHCQQTLVAKNRIRAESPRTGEGKTWVEQDEPKQLREMSELIVQYATQEEHIYNVYAETVLGFANKRGVLGDVATAHLLRELELVELPLLLESEDTAAFWTGIDRGLASTWENLGVSLP